MNKKFIRADVDCRKNYSTIVRKCANIRKYEADAPASPVFNADDVPKPRHGPAARGAIQPWIEVLT
jgi:hypothetical protein